MNIEIIPAMDLIDGACVRLAQGDYDRRTTYGRDPLDTPCASKRRGCGGCTWSIWTAPGRSVRPT